MLESAKQLLDAIKLGEDTFLELKSVRFAGRRITDPRSEVLADELAAMANGRGGVCLLGVEDREREIVGIPIDLLDAVEDLVHNVCRDILDPPLSPIIQRIWLPGAAGLEVAVVKIEVERSLFVHRSPKGYLHRVGSDKRVMSSQHLARLFQRRSQEGLVRFDERVVPGSELSDLSSAICRSYQDQLNLHGEENFLGKLHMVRRDSDGSLRPTVAGVLMASTDARRWLPNAYIQAVSYRGTSIATDGDDPYQLDAADFHGPLNDQVTQACRFVAKNMKVLATKAGRGREDTPQFDMAAVFEAVVNAVAHRDYSIKESKIRLRMFGDRLEIYSPGAIPNTMGVDELPYLQSTRNEIIASLLSRCPVPFEDIPQLDTRRQTMMDRRGEGVPIILENSRRLSGKKPEYCLIGDAELMLTIFAPTIGARSTEV